MNSEGERGVGSLCNQFPNIFAIALDRDAIINNYMASKEIMRVGG